MRERSDSGASDRAGADGSGRSGLAWCLLALAFAALLYGTVRTWPRTVDDAYITFRYAGNLVDGAGPVFNPGERVEGYSSPSWMILSAAAMAAGGDPILVAKLAGTGASLALLGVLFAALRRAGATGEGAALAALLLGSSMVLQIWAAAGMETNAYALAFFVGLAFLSGEPPTQRGVVMASTALAVAALTRPEGLAFWGLGLAAAFWRGGLRSAARYGVPGVALVAFFVWRLTYYGFPFPNTYYVKTGGGPELWRQGLYGLRLFVANPAHLPWIAAALLGTLTGLRSAKVRTATAVMAGATALHLLWVVSVGDDGLRIHRFYPPVLAPMAFLVGVLFLRDSKATSSARAMRIAGVIAVCLAVPLSVRALHTQVLRDLPEAALVYQEGNERLGILLKETRPAGTRIAVAAAGAIPYFSGLTSVDMYGLNDAHIAHAPFSPTRGGRVMKWDNAYVLSLRPELIVINRGYFRAGDPTLAEVERNPGVMATSPMDRDLFRRVSEDGAYTLRALRFPDGAVFFVFERRAVDREDAAASSRSLDP